MSNSDFGPFRVCSSERAYAFLEQQARQKKSGLLDFQAIVAPALEHIQHLVKEGKVVQKDVLKHVFSEIPPDQFGSEVVKSYILFLKQNNLLTAKDNHEVIQQLLYLGKEQVAFFMIQADIERVGHPDGPYLEQLFQIALSHNLVFILNKLKPYVSDYCISCSAIDVIKSGRWKSLEILISVIATRDFLNDIIRILGVFPSLNEPAVWLPPEIAIDIVQRLNLSDREQKKLLSEAIQAKLTWLMRALVELNPKLLQPNDFSSKTPIDELFSVWNQQNHDDCYSLGVLVAGLVQGGFLSADKAFVEYGFMFSVLASMRRLPEFLTQSTPNRPYILEELIHEFRLRTMGGNSCSLGKTEQFPYETLSGAPGLATLSERSISEAVVQMGDSSGLSSQERAVISEALLEADALECSHGSNAALESCLHKIHHQVPVILSTGTTKHKISVVVYKDLMIVCNRGWNDLHDNFTAFRIDSKNMTLEQLKALLVKEPHPDKKPQNNRFLEIAKALSPLKNGCAVQDEFCLAFATLKSKKQTVENCGYASPKAAFQALIICLKAPQEAPPEQIKKSFEEIRIGSKKALTEIRIYFLERYLRHRKTATITAADNYLIDKMFRSIQKRIAKDDYIRSPIELNRYPLFKEKFYPDQ